MTAGARLRTTRALGVALLGVYGGACSKAAPEPVASGTDAAPARPVVAAIADSSADDARARTIVPGAPTHEPTWDLGTADPAREYVVRYVRATRRYGEKTDCVAVGASIEKTAGARVVVVKDDPKSRCGGNAVRDAFVVDVDGDRLALDPASGDGGGLLLTWPDGSDPGGPPSPVRSMEDTGDWPSSLNDVLKSMKLTVVRVQLYGRGTYPVVTLAGFRAPVKSMASPTELAPVTAKVCAATKGEGLGLFGGLNRRDLLRIRCPQGARWEQL